MRFTRTCLFAAIFSISAGLQAQEPLPKNLDGTWEGLVNQRARVSGSISVTIDKQNPDGSLEGKLTYAGSQRCEATGDPMKGRFDGQTLTFQIALRAKYNNAGCPALSEFVLKKTADGHFSGEILNNENDVKVKLAPK